MVLRYDVFAFYFHVNRYIVLYSLSICQLHVPYTVEGYIYMYQRQ